MAVTTLTVYADAAPCPRVEVLITGLPAGAASVTLYRLAEGREYKVRGAINAPVAGALTRIDFEVPFGPVVSYRAEMFDVTGSTLGFTTPATVTVDVAETWIHNPLTPAGAIKAMFRGSAARELSRPSEGGVFYPQGRRVGVLIGGQRRGLQGVVLDIIVDDIATADRFAVMLGDYSTTTVPALCIRIGAADRVRLPRPLFVAVMDAREIDFNYALGGESIAYSMQGDEVSPPSPGLVIPLLTRADLNAFYATRAALNADGLTRLSVNRRYDLAGTAP